MKVIEWFKSLFKKKEIKLGECPEFMTKEKQVELANTGLKVEIIPVPEEKPIAKKKKRGRPRKKKMEQK